MLQIFFVILQKVNIIYMTRYKIIALDLDGTLTNSEKIISSATRNVLIEAQCCHSVKVVLASGRPTQGMGFLADELELDKHQGMVLAYNGGEITDWTSKRVIHKIDFPRDIVPYIYRYSRDAGFDIMTYIGKDIVTENPDNRFIKLSSQRNRMCIRKVNSFLDEINDKPIAKCMIVGEPVSLHKLEMSMSVGLDERVTCFRSEDYYLEVVPKGIDKGRCLQYVLDYYGLTREELIACGDGYNDISMIEFAGLGVAMANAKPQLKEVADYITLSNDDDGIVKVIKEFVF